MSETVSVEIKGTTYSMTLRNGWPISECWKCAGQGYIKGYEHSDGARCWACMTAGYSIPAAVSAILQAAKAGEIDGQAGREKAQLAYAKVLRSRELARVRAEKKRAAEFEVTNAAHLAAKATYEADVAALFEAQPLAVDATYWWNLTHVEAERDGDYYSPQHHPLYRQLKGYEFLGERYTTQKSLSPRMLEIAAETTAKLIGAKDAPVLAAGRQTIVGVMGKAKPVDKTVGYRDITVWKVVVTLDSGQRVYGSIPAAVLDAYHAEGKYEDGMEGWTVGKRVQFDAAVEVSEDDPGFGYYSRPTKARLVEVASV